MTLNGKRNHYNVKLPRGYGVSINLKDHQVILKDGMNDISGKSEICLLEKCDACIMIFNMTPKVHRNQF